MTSTPDVVPGMGTSGSREERLVRPRARFVGRRSELAGLLEGLQETGSGNGRLYLLAGEPGIGKSRLAEEVAALAVDRGAVALWGRCWEAGGAPAYWPWAQAIRSYIRETGAGRVAEEVGQLAADLAHLVPEIRRALPDPPPPAVADAETARFRLFEATTEFLRWASAEQPVVLVLDDLQAADEPSLLLLQFVGRQLAGMRLLVVGTYRDTDLTEDHPLSAALAELSREPVTRRLSLRGLGQSEVGTLIQEVARVAVPDAVVATLSVETEGNPLFLLEVVRLLSAEGRLQTLGEDGTRLTIPQGVREVIARRLKGLSEECVRVLSVASVLGREFVLEPLRRMTERSFDRLLEILDEALAARLITEVPGTLGRLRFSHALVGEALYDRLTAAQRLRLHQRAGEALAELYADDVDAHLAEIAHHYIRAAPAGDVETAVGYARRAGEGALDQLAYEEAARLFDMALQALELGPKPSSVARADLLLQLADAQSRSGDLERGKETLLRAAEAARKAGLPDRLARAAIAYGGRFVWPRAGSDPHMLPLLEEALEALGPRDSELRVRILARLAAALRDEPSKDRRLAMSREAVAAARRLADPGALAYALAGDVAAAMEPPVEMEERQQEAAELVEVAEAAGDLELVFEGRAHQFMAAVALGDRKAIDAVVGEFARLASELRQPAQEWLLTSAQAVLALSDGRLSEAETMLFRALELGERAQNWDATAFSRVQLFGVRRELGTLEGIEPTIEQAIGEYPTRPLFRCILANVYAHLGRAEDAWAVLERLGEAEFSLIPSNNDWSLSMTLLAETAAHLGDRERSETLYRLMLPLAAYNVETLELTTGSFSRQLGRLAATLGRWDDAEHHFEEARQMNARAGFQTWVAHTLYDWARMLGERDGPGDRDRATALLAQAGAMARDLGLVALAEDAQRELDASGGGVAPVVGSGQSEQATAGVFRREGEYFSIVYGNEAFRLKDSKGLRFLARLLANPGREIHVLDLASQSVGRATGGPAAMKGLATDAGAGAGDILDRQAREQYRTRLHELQEDIEEAESFGDAERAARAREEMEFLAAELAGATGLGGRPRKAPSPAERARVNVTKAIKVARRRIREHSPALDQHLEATLHTGTFCSYTPDPRAPASWRV